MKTILFHWLCLLFVSTAFATDVYLSDNNQVIDDLAEPDNSYTQASVIVLNDPEPQYHNFYSQNDKDWVKFYGIAHERYKIEVYNLQANCDAKISLFYSNQLQLIASVDDFFSGEDEKIEMDLPYEGIYYICIENYEGQGAETGYNIAVFRPHSCPTHLLKGSIVNIANQKAVSNAIIKTHLNDTGISLDNGTYQIYATKCSSNPLHITVQSQEFMPWTYTMTLADTSETNLSIEMTPENYQKQEYYVFDRLWPFQVNPFSNVLQSKKSFEQMGLSSQIAIDNDGFMYMADTDQSCIKKMDASFKLLSQWGEMGTDNGQFNHPQGIALDNDNNVYVADTGNHRIQKFLADGTFMTKWGERGIFPGQLNSPTTIFIHPDQKVYVMDSGNYRYQIFKKVDTLPDMKAIIVAGQSVSGIYQRLSAMACHALLHQGYTWDRIAWLSEPVDLDNYQDQVDYAPLKKNLEQCVVNWASDSSSLVLYLIGDAQTDHFQLSSDENLLFSELHTWLTDLQTQTDSLSVIVYDAAYGKNFISALSTSTHSRLMITSTDKESKTQLFGNGDISFSTYFWQAIISGKSVYDAWNRADHVMNKRLHTQTPQMEFFKGDIEQAKNMFLGAGTSFECAQMNIQSFTAYVMPDEPKIYIDVQVDNDSSAKAFLYNTSNILIDIDLALSDEYHYTASLGYQNIEPDIYHIGAVTIRPDGSISEPEVLTLTTPAYVSPGDMNGDGVIGLVDLILILQVLVSNP